MRASRFAVQRRFDGRWAITDTESTSGVLVLCASEDEAKAMLVALRAEAREERARRSDRTTDN
jgi:hypothetical protein